MITDYIPTGMSFVSSPDFSATTPHIATIALLPAYESKKLSITLQIDPTFQGLSMTNNAEITDANNEYDMVDEDDDIANQDGSSDDTSEVDTDGDQDDSFPGTPGTTDNPDDEDSYDPAVVTVGQSFDLAIEKMIDTITNPGPYEAGENVTFTVEVFNQGTLTATGIQVIDYIPTGMTFVSSPDFSATVPHTATVDTLA